MKLIQTTSILELTDKELTQGKGVPEKFDTPYYLDVITNRIWLNSDTGTPYLSDFLYPMALDTSENTGLVGNNPKNKEVTAEAVATEAVAKSSATSLRVGKYAATKAAPVVLPKQKLAKKKKIVTKKKK